MYDKLSDGTSLPYYVFDCVRSKLQVEYKQMYHANSVSINKVESVLRVTQGKGKVKRLEPMVDTVVVVLV